MHNIRDILNDKGPTVWSASPDESVLDGIRRMAEHDLGALLVMKGDELVGFFSERDYTRKVILRGLRSEDTPVSAIMSTPVLTISPDATVQQGLTLMTDKGVRHLPVTDGPTVIGMVSIRDLAKAVVDEQQVLIEQLERYLAR